MMVLKPNGIFQALYAEFQTTDKNLRQHKKPAKALYFFSIFIFKRGIVNGVELRSTRKLHEKCKTGKPRKSSFLPDKAFLASKKLDIS